MNKGRRKIQINLLMDVELVKRLDRMRAVDENTRSQFIRKTIRREWVRRYRRMANPIQKINNGDG